MKLYIANKNYSSWSLRPWVLMRERNIAFDEVLVPFEGSHNFENFRKFSPSGRVPCLVDGDTTVWDSLAIAEYLAEQHSGVWPADGKARAWARCASAEMHSGFGTLRSRCSMTCGLRVRLHEWPAALEAEWRRMDELWREGLDRFGGPYLAGKEFTAVDAFYAPVAFRVQTYTPTLSEAASGYVGRLLARPSMVAWYDDALVEPWRDEDHERETVALGVVLNDDRT